MKALKQNIILLTILLITISLTAQEVVKKDSIKQNLKFNYKQLIIPTVLISYGAIGIEKIDYLKDLNLEIREEVINDIDGRTTFDDFSQYAPAATVYALNNLGIQGKNNLKDRSVILGTSFLLVFTSVTALKRITNIERPDGTSYSFPSGHTATAFAGAEFLWQEYKDKSIWYGISGYAVATATGIFRIINNKHWLTDVAAGAGIGILSTKIAYWLNPYMKAKIFNSTEDAKTVSMIVPFYNGKEIGLGLLLNLK
ncbi:phosphatase PAP2 family protein [Flavobacterium sp. GT3R68]|uniref:phosphatase PAP2 family protein n=1 Tax=Flavobacterium sp. GT3R68 TaxID=2594437 RepID=UPI000F873103|nr:phosphatase PAP2 family protein [Flavobacterium sp. GT3R68]RTY90606.1 phosphatase PAP2 family protein [Flavobacterium sp. GSN2]TRW89868.1 phosphatase PAP2 family protein [Flavobacterium sp. GT3R68]